MGVTSRGRARFSSAAALPSPSAGELAPALTLIGTVQDGGLDARFVSGRTQVDCGSAPALDEVIVPWALVFVTSGVSGDGL